MKHRRQFLRDGLASLLMVAPTSFETLASPGNPIVGMKAIYERELPPVNLAGWRLTVLELTFPPATASPKHLHPGFILGYVLEGELRSHLEGEPEKFWRQATCFTKLPVAFTCLPAAPAQPGKREFSPWHSVKKERRLPNCYE